MFMSRRALFHVWNRASAWVSMMRAAARMLCWFTVKVPDDMPWLAASTWRKASLMPRPKSPISCIPDAPHWL